MSTFTPSPAFVNMSETLNLENKLFGLCVTEPESFTTAMNIIGERDILFPPAAGHNPVRQKLWAGLCAYYRDGMDAAPTLRDLQTYEPGWDAAHLNNFSASLSPDDTPERIAARLVELAEERDMNTYGLKFSSVRAAGEPGTPLFRHGLVPGSFGVAVGPDGAGKGFLLLDVLLSCASGHTMSVPSLKHEGERLRCMYIGYEDPPEVLRYRLEAVCKDAALPADFWCPLETEGRLQFVTDAGPLFVQRGGETPQPTAAFKALSRHLKENSMDLCVIDPFRAAALLNNEADNSARHAVAVALRDMADDTGCAMVIVHHASKGMGRLGRAAVRDHQMQSGGGALVTAARWVLNLTSDTAEPDTLELAVAKNSYGARLYDVVLERNPHTGTLREVSHTEIGQTRERLVGQVVDFIHAHPELQINPRAVKFRSSAAAKALLETLNAKPRDVFAAIEQAVSGGLLTTTEVPKANKTGYVEILIPPPAGGVEDTEGEDFEDDTF
ncbi:MAG: Regulatory protein RepA [Candidatus Hydrogenedentes bacterium ADurb.Bin179]|nr:MAG: Regulatory protein RepA [Candidatus Hydrogenedentes bacterium ADurb.Bin179]